MNHNKRKIFSSTMRQICGVGLLLFLSILLIACDRGEPTPTTQPPAVTEKPVEPIPTDIPPTPEAELDLEQIYDVLWVLVGFGDAANPRVIERDTIITLVVSPDGTVSGSSGCNNYSSSYEIDTEGTISFTSPFAATMMHCPQGMDQEAAYLTAIQNSQNLVITPEGRLEVFYESGQVFEEKLVYTQGETPLVDTQWLLLAYGDVGSPSLVESGISITAIFSEDGNVSGFAGCNHYAGSFEANGDQMSIGPLATTAMACPEASDQEQEYLVALGSAQTYQLFGQRMTIDYHDGQGSLIYTSANLPLEGTLWTLAAIEGEQLVEEISITALFEPNEDEVPGTVAGSAGCNSYSASYEVEQDKLSIETPLTTQKFCETGMEEEIAYLSAIEGENTYEIIGDNLDLVTGSGTLTYVADRTPLVGALWVLVSIGDKDEPQEPVEGSIFTAQFSRNPNAPSGVVAGTTGCNEYSAAYTANLEEIKVNLPAKTRNEDCVPGLFEQEQQYFLAMHDAREYQIHGSILFIPYDEGNQMLVFAATQTQMAGKRPLSELDGTQWFLHFINDASILPGTLIDARFTVNADGQAGRIAGSAGCNTYNAAFTQEIGVQTSLSSSTICFTPEGVKDQENTYLSSLSRAYGYWLTGDQLMINTGLGALTYRQTPPESAQDQTHLLQNRKWYLFNYNDKPSVVGNTEPFIFFNLDSTFIGNTGCNEIGGEYTTDLESISFRNIELGDLACPDETSNKQERVILANLEAAQTYIVADTSMQIASDRGVLSYSSVPVQRPEPGELPTAIIIGPEEASVGEIVRFDGSSSTSEIGITDYAWDYGDGTQGKGPRVEKIFVDPGTFQVTLVVADKIGQRGSATKEINIIAQPPEQTPPTAVIAGPAEGFVAEPITFNADGSSSGSSPITSFTWDFGDGIDTPASPNTSVTTIYESSGTFTVTLTATDANGLSASDSMQIRIDTRLEGPVWSLLEVLSRTGITMQFLQGEFEGFGSCNTYSGTYTAIDNGDGTYQVEINEINSSRLVCTEEIMEQEVDYLAALADTNSATIEGNLLILNGDTSELVYYEVGTLKPEQLPE